MLRRLSLFALPALVLGAIPPVLSQPADRVLVLVLDASGSMWARIGDGTRIEVARQVLDDFLAGRDAATPLGVIAYGHRRKGDCGDIEILAETGLQDPAALSARLRALNPRGKTPLAESLRLAARQIPPTAEEADIILVTDGLETCQSDPCQVAGELAAEGIRVRAHVVGFGLTEQEAQALACVPEATGGRLLRPQTGAELAAALRETVQPAPAQPVPPGQAGIYLALAGNRGDLPDSVEWSIRDEAGGQVRVLGTASGPEATGAYPVELAPGTWTALARSQRGQGELTFQVEEGDDRTFYVPFIGELPTVVIPNRGPYTAGMQAAFAVDIQQEGQAQGGADFYLGLYPKGVSDYAAPLTYNYVGGSRGVTGAGLQLPDEPGEYTVAFVRNEGNQPVLTVDIRTEASPAVELQLPAQLQAGTPVPVIALGGQHGNDRSEFHRQGELVGWDQSRTLNDLYFPGDLPAPAEPGEYEVVYWLHLPGGDEARIVARQPVTVVAGEPGE